MSLPPDLKHLYAEWLQELINGLNPRQEQLSLTYDKARKNLLDEQTNVYYPRDLKKIRGIGDTIMRRLEKRLQIYCNEIGVEVPQPQAATELQGSLKRSTTTLRSGSLNGTTVQSVQEGPVRKKQRKYIPKKRSGGYSILLALLEGNAITRGLNKDAIIEIAQRYCDSSMNPNFMTKEFRGAWSSMKSLLKHDLVVEQGRPKTYFLTDDGLKMAKTLKLADNIVFANDLEAREEGIDYEKDAETEVTADLNELLGSAEENRDLRSENLNSSLMDITFHDSESPSISKRATLTVPRTLAISTPLSSKKSVQVPLQESSKNSSSKDQILRRRFNGISYEFWQGGTYEIYPIIDHREVKSQNNRDFFLKGLDRKGTKCEIRQLALGDIIWIAKNRTTGGECILNTIIERKRLDDLAISIRDNRFMEQKSRLEKSGCRNKYYLIEETTARTMEGMTEALKTALWVILVYYRFSMIRTINADETVEKLQALHTVLTKEYLNKSLIVIFPNDLKNQDDYVRVLDTFRSEFEKQQNLECCHTYQCFQEILGKGEMSTIGELTIRVLMFIKGVSIEKAVAIQQIFPTLNHILTAYSECKSEADSKMLMFDRLGDAPGAKKISKSLSEKIADVFGNV